MSTCEITLRCMPQNSFVCKSTLVQVMAWCHPTTSHYLIQCWHRSSHFVASLCHDELIHFLPVDVSSTFNTYISNSIYRFISYVYIIWNCPYVNAAVQNPEICSGNVLVLTGSMPLLETMLTKFYDAIWHHQGVKELRGGLIRIEFHYGDKTVLWSITPACILHCEFLCWTIRNFFIWDFHWRHGKETFTGIILGMGSTNEMKLHCNVVSHWLSPSSYKKGL